MKQKSNKPGENYKVICDWCGKEVGVFVCGAKCGGDYCGTECAGKAEKRAKGEQENGKR